MVQAARYYESKVPLLGSEFLSEVRRVVKGIEAHPEAAPKVRADIRRRILRRFPYAVLYKIDHDEIVILAVMHQRRQPDYWHGRE
ncbi:MAG: type II toxin-antitoxin system RelE/ParE family toxin [Gammaproteobacteria bacterium]|nr:MAG: type II toxin-antitoxin system RelE/ParE family toxin [Gammaproteobacteria bacterium]